MSDDLDSTIAQIAERNHGLFNPRYRRARHDGLVVHESRVLDDADLVLRFGMSVRSTVVQGIERSPGDRVADSAPERLLAGALSDRGLATPVLQHIVRDVSGAFVARVDLAYPDELILIEYESFEHHTGMQALVRDSARRKRAHRARLRRPHCDRRRCARRRPPTCGIGPDRQRAGRVRQARTGVTSVGSDPTC